jgi:hypothetical protein
MVTKTECKKSCVTVAVDTIHVQFLYVLLDEMKKLYSRPIRDVEKVI